MVFFGTSKKYNIVSGGMHMGNRYTHHADDVRLVIVKIETRRFYMNSVDSAVTAETLDHILECFVSKSNWKCVWGSFFLLYHKEEPNSFRFSLLIRWLLGFL
ncbi:hypothetical protein ACJX0J_034263, partial [Zea mays]